MSTLRICLCERNCATSSGFRLGLGNDEAPGYDSTVLPGQFEVLPPKRTSLRGSQPSVDCEDKKGQQGRRVAAAYPLNQCSFVLARDCTSYIMSLTQRFNTLANRLPQTAALHDLPKRHNFVIDRARSAALALPLALKRDH